MFEKSLIPDWYIEARNSCLPRDEIKSKLHDFYKSNPNKKFEGANLNDEALELTINMYEFILEDDNNS